MGTERRKRISLTLSESPIKSKKNTQHNNDLDIIDLISDDEEEISVCEGNDLNLNRSMSCSPNATIVYTPKKTPPSTPTKFQSPTSKGKYYSPSKKRRIVNKSPAKRNLDISLRSGFDMDEDFSKLIQGYDSNTIFLIEIISQYLKDTNLRPLLTESSVTLLENCKKVKIPGMRLVCRLYWRQERWYQWKTIKTIARSNYTADVDDSTLLLALNSLLGSGFFEEANCSEPNHGFHFDELVKILKAEEIKEICKEFKLKTTTKGSSVDALKSYIQQKNITNYMLGCKSNNETRVLKVMGNRVGRCYRLTEQACATLTELYLLMYLGIDPAIISEKKLELMLLNERTNKETYPSKELSVDNASAIFKSREEFERYMTAHNMYDEFLSATDSSQRYNIVRSAYKLYTGISKEDMTSYIALPQWLHRFAQPCIYMKILGKGIPDLKNGTEAGVKLACKILTRLISQTAFQQHKKAEWYAEKALILDKLMGKHEEAAEVLLEGLTADLPTDGVDLLSQRACKLTHRKTKAISEQMQTKLGLMTILYDDKLEKNIKAKHVYKLPMDNYGKGKLKFKMLTAGGETLVMSAEEYCIYHYKNEDGSKYTHGGHWEGRIVTTIFFLLFWDVIYAQLRGLRGIFLSRYQKYPLDMFCDSFYANRKPLITERLLEIENSTSDAMLEKMQATWNSRPECEISEINRNIGWETVRDVAECLGPLRVSALCRTLAKNYRHWHSGFPDLTLWNNDTRQIIFVEVKTDMDKPSIKQIQWMNYLKAHDIKTEFCYVGVNTMRNRNRNCLEVSDDE